MPEPGPDPYAYVDPSWAPPVAAPPADRRPGWLPLLAVIMVTVLVAGGLFVNERSGADARRAADADAASRFLPGDGTVGYQQRTTTVGGATTSSKHVQESARQGGALVLAGLDFTLGTAVLKVVGFDGLDRMSFWRTTGSMLENLGSSQQQVRVYRVDGDIALVAESGPGAADVYTPALVALPARVVAGDTWSSAGSVGARRYRSEFRAAAAESGCLQVDGSIEESSTAGQAAVSRRVSRLWCEGRGIVTEQTTVGQVSTVTETTSPPSPDRTLRTADEQWSWGDPATWRQRDFDLLSADHSLGSGIMTGSASQVPPVVTASGLVFRVTNGDDLVATTPKTVDRWISLWRMHPGGTVLSMAAFGDVLVVSTSQRELVGYSDAGIRLWSVTLDDVAWWAPQRVDERRVAVGDAAGGVRVLDLLSGEVSWQQRVETQVSGPVVADAQHVVVLDAGGGTTAFAADTGDQQWSREIPGERAAILGEVVVVRNQGTLEALDLQTGRHRWMLSRPGTLDALQPYGDVLLAATQLGTIAVDERGVVVQRLPAYERLTVVGDLVVGWGATEAEIRRRDWTVLATIDTPDASLAHALGPTLAYRQGVMLFGRGWTFTTWSDEP